MYSCETVMQMYLVSLVPLQQLSILQRSSSSNDGEKRHGEETVQGEKCELLAVVAAHFNRLPMWKDLTVSSPLRWAWSRGNTIQSPARSPTCEQLQAPSARASWWLPKGSALHPSISDMQLHCFDREGFQGLMKSAGPPSVVVCKCTCLLFIYLFFPCKMHIDYGNYAQAIHHFSQDMNRVGAGRSSYFSKSIQ